MNTVDPAQSNKQPVAATPLAQFPIIQEGSKGQLASFAPLFIPGLLLLTLLVIAGLRRLSDSASYPSTFSELLPSESFKSSPNPPAPTSPTTLGHHVICPPDRPDAEINIRQSPGLSAPILSVIPCTATGVQVIGEGVMTDGEFWVLVKYQANQGWIVRRFLSD